MNKIYVTVLALQLYEYRLTERSVIRIAITYELRLVVVIVNTKTKIILLLLLQHVLHKIKFRGGIKHKGKVIPPIHDITQNDDLERLRKQIGNTYLLIVYI